MDTDIPQTAPETADSDKAAGKYRQRAVDNKEFAVKLEWMITLRFIMEVHRIESEGRARNRTQLEQDLYLPLGTIASMRNRKWTRVAPATLHLMKAKYNADLYFMVMGGRVQELAGPIRLGVDLRKGGRVYDHPYKGPAHPELVALQIELNLQHERL